jgi:hypothetical protein
MKKAKERNDRQRSAKSSAATRVSRDPVNLADIRQQITNLVGNGALGMVETTIEEVGKGHYLGMKYLFELIGHYPGTAGEEAPVQDSMAATLLRRLGLRNCQCRNKELPKISKCPMRFQMMA